MGIKPGIEVEIKGLTGSFLTVAARPHLKKKGCVTLHALTGNNQPDYAHALAHVYQTVFLRNVFTSEDHGRAKRIKNGESHKIPCSSLVGELIGFSEAEYDRDPEIFYNPREGFHGMAVQMIWSGPRSMVVALRGKQAWVVRV